MDTIPREIKKSHLGSERVAAIQDIEVGLLYDRWRHYLYPPPQFRHGTEGEGNIFQPRELVVSVATAHKTFRPTDLTSTYSMYTRRVSGVIGHRIQAFRSGVRCSNHKATYSQLYPLVLSNCQ
ncbi:uncharacterized protein TNCV_523101 [Trichonephila clavipes]|nr:uncharacterized protein TNCV_523101 [Trichonephila clavipes]